MSFGVSGSNPYNYTFTTGSVENAGSAETTGSVQTAGSAQTTGSVKGTVNTIVYEATAARVGASQSASGITYTGSNSVDLVILDAKKALESINCSVGDIDSRIPSIMKELTAGNAYLEEMLAAKIDLLRQDENKRRESLVNEIVRSIENAVSLGQVGWDADKNMRGGQAFPQASQYNYGTTLSRTVSFSRNWYYLENTPEWITGGRYTVQMTVVRGLDNQKSWQYGAVGVHINWNRI